ncbi:MAG: hypothetical protein LM583_09325, partial [Desulfurococcaceae archaeon]|nr:hypothetical protein [Desulfurococcaceae archaeon]
MNLKNLKTITSILFVTLIALSIAPATLSVVAQYASSFSVVTITSSRATGTFYKNQVFYVFIDLSSLTP